VSLPPTAALFPLGSPAGLIAGWILLALAAGGGVWVTRRLVAVDTWERRFLTWLLCTALAVRWAVAVFVFYALPYGYFAPDEIGYLKQATRWVFQGDHRIAPPLQGNGWPYVDIAFLAAFNQPLLIGLFSSLAGTFAAVPAYQLSKRLGGGRAAAGAAILVAFFPSTLLWSTLNLKDSTVYLVVMAALLLVTELQRSLRIHVVGAFLVLVLVVHSLRPLPDVALLITALASILAARFGRPLAIAGAGLLVALVSLALIFPATAQGIYVWSGLSQVANMRRAFGEGARSAVDTDPGLQTFAGAVHFLPQALVDFFLRPFPWESGSTQSVLSRPEVLLWYALIPIIALGAVSAVRRNPVPAVAPLAYLVITGIAYSFVISNLGTIYRERGQLLLVMFVLVGPALAAISTTVRASLSSRGRGTGAKVERPENAT
jgi:hypothetical protein